MLVNRLAPPTWPARFQFIGTTCLQAGAPPVHRPLNTRHVSGANRTRGLRLIAAALLALLGLIPAESAAEPVAGALLRLVTPAVYRPGLPILVRVEVIDPATGRPDRNLWDADINLTATPATVTLSTNQISLRNGLGSTLVTFTGGGDFTLAASLGTLSTNRALASKAATSPTLFGGTLPANTTWTGVVQLTNTVTVPAGRTLTIDSNTIVLINGVASGTAGIGLVVNGTLNSLGTEAHPVTITCANAGMRWGQIRHDNAASSLYRHTFINLGGRAPGEGHTGQAPVLRPNTSTIVFENCSITDVADATGTPGKIGYAINSDLTFRNCLLSRARMGPEIQGTALTFTNSWILEMRGPDDSDGIYLHDQQAGQQIRLMDSVIGFGDDDGIDTLSADVSVENCIIRNWPNPNEDAKGISAFSRTVSVKRCLIVDCWVGVSAKTTAGVAATVLIDHSTIIGISNTVAASFKANATGPIIDFRITNSILQGVDPVRSDFAPTNFTIGYCALGEAWPGVGNLNVNPLFINEAGKDFHLRAASAAINAGNPASPLDPDGTRADLGFFPFLAGTNTLIAAGSIWKYLDNGSDQAAAWRAPSFDDSAWLAGFAQLGYGDGDETTVVAFGPNANAKFVTTYFRRAFTTPDAGSYTNLNLRLLRDDGAVVYLNGVEIYRAALPAGPIAFDTLAATLGENTVDNVAVNNALPWLVDGLNVIAAEIHQQSLNSSDISFDLELVGMTGTTNSPALNTPPTVTLTAPLEGATYGAPALVPLAATAADSDGGVAKVEFFQNGTKIGEDVTAPYSLDWSGVASGLYSVTAVATDNQGATAVSAPVHITVNASSGPTTNTLIAAGSVWKYLDNGSDPGAAWTGASFDDASWASGPAQLGYGDGDEATVISFGPDANNKFVTSYFRRAFTVTDPSRIQQLLLNIQRDDGAITYLNGVEVFRQSMTPGPVTFQTLATTASEYTFEGTTVPASLLVAGPNIIACEVHQGTASSSDVSFDLELLAVQSGETNSRPTISVTSPADGITVAAPASLSLTAAASDPDGTVTNVAFYAGATKLADDPTPPFSFTWSGVGAGAYTLTAVASDNFGLTATSTVVNVTVSTNTAPPVVFAKLPAPGNVTSLSQIAVTFSKAVVGVDATDLLVNGQPATGLTGSGSNYTFSFSQPAFGAVAITWSAAHGIADAFTPPATFNSGATGATWQYQLLDSAPPVMSSLTPAPESSVPALTSVSISFSEPVNGVNAADLLVNSVPCVSVNGSGAGPYVFSFPQPAATSVHLAWIPAHGIQDASGNVFAGGGWNYTIDTNAVGVVISEIMYHPSSENPLEEYIEIYNQGASAINLGGWNFNGGVHLTLPAVVVPAGGYLVLAADTNVFSAKYPDVANVVGNWTGTLNNNGENLSLDDALGNRVDAVRYADEGDWAVRQRGANDPGTGGQPHRGWEWTAEHDGLGKSLELINVNLSNNEGQNWAASRIAQGTPGTANSVRTNNLAPLILNVTHVPAVPRSSDPIVVTARLLDESPNGLAATLYYRADAASPPPFTSLAMRDDGTGGDIAPGDGLYTATLAAQPNNTIVEFYILATDGQGLVRTWPAPAIAAPDGTGPTGQVANALFQVDNTILTSTNGQPLFKLIMTDAERAELAAIPGQSSSQGPNAQMNGTFISIDGAGTSVHYLASFRNRGHGSRTANPPNYHVAFRTDDRWKNVTGLNLNTRYVHLQHLGTILARQSGVNGAESIPAQVRVNNQNLAVSGSPMFGAYAANEEVTGEWAAHHYPDDPGGNIYRAVRDIAPPDFSYRGETKGSYTNTYFKESNLSADNWSDLIGMLRVIGNNNPTAFTTDNVRQVVNVEQWMRHFAFMNIVNNRETGLNTGYNDDYFMYAGLTDPRFILTYWDLDTILGGGDSPGSTTDGIYTASGNNGSGLAIDRFLRWPDFEPIYFDTLRELLGTVFAPTNFDATVDYHLGNYAGSQSAAIKNWMSQRRNYLLSVIPGTGVTNAPVAVITGIPRSPTPLTSASLSIGGAGVLAYRYSLNGAAYTAEAPVATPITLNGLANRTNSLAVIGRTAAGIYQASSNASTRTWIVNTAWPAVRLNEVLAQNDTSVNHAGTYPDLIELFNEGATTVDLSNLRLTDDPTSPNKFTFPAGTTLAAGAYLVVYANNPDGTSGLHLGFSLEANGEAVYLVDRAANGNVILDSVIFGLQLPDRSIGRLGGSGDWSLNQPTFGSANLAQSLGQPSTLRINEWLASGLTPNPDDFVELYNPDPLPVELAGLALTDQPIGAPHRSVIAPLSFIGGTGFRAFVADGQKSPANHVNFKLAVEQGEIGLVAPNHAVIDQVIYAPQKPGAASGRCPDGGTAISVQSVPTPGSPNACPPAPPSALTVNLVPLDQSWRYEESGSDLGTDWTGQDFNDGVWLSGAALLGFDTNLTPPEPIRTALNVVTGKITFYFRTHFNLPANLNVAQLQLTHAIDDGAVFYLNGLEAGRFNMPAGAVNFSTLAPLSHEATTLETVTLDKSALNAGDNVLAVEVHQNTASSSDVVFGARLDAVIVTNTPVVAGVVINEVLANNASLEEPDGSKPDWIEIYNPSTSAVDLGDMSLTDDPAAPRRWTFPSGSILPALGYRRVRFDAGLLSSSTNTGFGLKATGGAAYLYHRLADGGGLASFVTYGLQAADFSLGRIPDGSTNWVLTVPTFGGANIAAALGNPASLMINEWMASPDSGDDWFELYNPNPQPVELSGLWLSDSLANTKKYSIPARSFIGAGPLGFLRFWAANGADGDYTGFNLSGSGEDLAVSTSAGTVINGLHFSTQPTGISEGRLPDGTTNLVRFLTTSTPGHGNFLPIPSVVINEVLAHTDPPLEDAVEVFNPTGDDVDISGWYLSDSEDNLLKYRVPGGTIVRAGGFKVFYEYEFNFNNPGTPFSFSSAKGDQVYLSASTGAGNLTGYRAYAEFDASENGVSFGRYATSIGTDFTALGARTFGADTPATTNEFRTGTGRTNAYPKIGPVVINEIMYHQAGTNEALEFVELLNILGTPLPLFDPANPLNTWRIRKGIDFEFPTNVSIPAGGYVVLVNFDPATDAANLSAFRAAYGSAMTVYGPYRGKLDNSSDTIELQKPDAPQSLPGPDFGRVPYIAVDRVSYSDTAPWPASPDGLGDSLRRVTPSQYGNDPVNWSAGSPSPGANNGGGASTNTAPVLNPIGNRSVAEGSLLAFTATATDAQAHSQTLTFSLDAGAPAGALITAGGNFSWTPTELQGPGSFPITIRVSDSGSPILSAAETITVTVLETNSVPTLNPIGNKTASEGSPLAFTATASDADFPTQALTFSLDSGAPTGATITASGNFAWTPGETNGGNSYSVTIRVTDNGSPQRSAAETITIAVSEINSAPVLAALTNRLISAGSTLSFTVAATDVDLPIQPLTFSLQPGAPASASLGATTGLFTWTPATNTPTGTNLISVRVTDGALSDLKSFSVVVVGAPRITNIARTSTSTVVVDWTSYPGKTYRVQGRTDLSSGGSWISIGSAVTATGYGSSLTVSTASESLRFFRVVLVD